jgi:hypothetical protein
LQTTAYHYGQGRYYLHFQLKIINKPYALQFNRHFPVTSFGISGEPQMNRPGLPPAFFAMPFGFTYSKAKVPADITAAIPMIRNDAFDSTTILDIRYPKAPNDSQALGN